MKKIVIAVFVIFMGAGQIAAWGAGSLSDLNTTGFQSRTKPAALSAENPFLKRELAPSDLMVEDLTLTGIVYHPEEAYALISGYIIREGDDIAGYKVKVVERDHVVLRQLDQVRILKLE